MPCLIWILSAFGFLVASLSITEGFPLHRQLIGHETGSLRGFGKTMEDQVCQGYLKFHPLLSFMFQIKYL
jgi:hypothetical protein